MKKITVADMLESMGVSVTPFALDSAHLRGSVFEGVRGCHREPSGFAVQNLWHKNFVPDSRPNASNETDEDVPESTRGTENDDTDDEERAEDLGLDAQKQKQQVTDEMDYEDGSDEEQNEGPTLAGLESEIDMSEDDNGTIENDANGSDNEKDEIPDDLLNAENRSKEEKTKSEPKRRKFVKKETDRAIFSETKGLHFEVHFKFVNEPHILLAQIAEKTAKKVYIQRIGKIDQCQVTDCSENQVFYYGEDPKRRKSMSDKGNIPALHTAGVDFGALWKMEDHLDVRYLYSNNIHAMLNTDGVEAARETIISEISNVFTSYGIAVNIRHLTLIADFMTHSGRYRPMSRLGGIAESISPFSKMTFETASRFIVEAARHGLMDNLETPSSRICTTCENGHWILWFDAESGHLMYFIDSFTDSYPDSVSCLLHL
ncbi:Detected protein of confused Function [Hibiscus syriacus]|uniref:DNA-directed RNA polymerase n=1 Tax=Hibiscus syriacus TaxID=106335 RepID=A0A6A3CCC2_HIBSY|nr:Detected protein of confused Function [Hibiscus syriacus]